MLYAGNGLAIAIKFCDNDHKEYFLDWFWCDETHAKNMLGISKGYTNCMSDYCTEFHLNLNHPHSAKIAKLLIQAKKPVTITLEEP